MTSKPLKPSRPIAFIIWLCIAACVIALDQVSKTWVVHHFMEKESQIVTGFFNLVRRHNPGAAFSFLGDASGWQRWLFTALAVMAACVIVWLLRKPNQPRDFCVALSLILGGAIGNVVDRIAYGYVIDFIEIHAAGWAFPAFNVADSAISANARAYS
jgi:signal peptidase II